MKLVSIIAVVFATGLVYAQNSVDHSKHTDHAAHADSKTQSSPEKKFKADDDLKSRMEKILNLTKDAEAKKKSIKDVKDYGNQIIDVVNDIFKTCKLEPDADAAIHPALAKVLEGATDFKNGKFKTGQPKIHQALLTYEKLFIHEGWKH